MKLSKVLNSLMLVLSLSIASCARSGSPRVFFVDPQDGATVSNPVQIVMGAENFTIEPAGAVNDGAGHLHLILSGGCVPAGQEIPNDETHLHLGDGQTSTEIQLSPGTYTLCLQAGDGQHIALEGEGMQNEITIQVG
jgi:hypothetical protein